MALGEIVQPTDAGSVADILKQAGAEGLAVEVRGAGTKSSWGTRLAPANLTLSTLGLTSPIEHYAGDLTATVPAGLSLDALNDVLRRERQWLPLDPPSSDRATIGGILATNDSGPRRHRFGTPRDLIIGVQMALADGRLAKAGGRVVKNVAGFDLGKLLCGSFGSLAVITSATFKLAPVAPASRTLVATFDDLRGLGDMTLALVAAPLDPTAIEVDLAHRTRRLLVRFETTPAAAEQQCRAAGELCERRGAKTTVLADQEETDAWRDYQAGVWGQPGTLVKIAILPTDVRHVLEQLERISAAHGVDHRVAGRAGLGVLYVRVSGDAGGHRAIVTELRHEVTRLRGSVVLLSQLPADTGAVDLWGEIGDAFEVMRAVKARFDPGGILNPGRGPGGL